MTYNAALKKRIVRHDLIEKIGMDRYNLQLKQFKKEVEFSRKLYDKEREYEEVSEREYNHDSFGFYREDDLFELGIWRSRTVVSDGKEAV